MRAAGLFACAFMLASCGLNEPKTPHGKFPKQLADTSLTSINAANTITVLLEGKARTLFYYEGAFDPQTAPVACSMDSVAAGCSFASYLATRNAALIRDMAALRDERRESSMADSTFTRRENELREKHSADTPFFFVKWGGNAKYADVIVVLDLLKRSDITRYYLSQITKDELSALATITGEHYPELNTAEGR